MLKMLISTVILITSLSSYSSQVKQFPDPNHTYDNGDRGFSQYLAPSLYKTNQVALTFDDGPHPTRTPQLLDTLKKFNVKATFFVLASKINKASESIIERIVKEGHILASHDWDHDNNNIESKEVFKNELKKSILTIRSGQEKFGDERDEMYYRFPYAAYGHGKDYHHMNIMKEVSTELFGDNCINFVFWDIDTADWVEDMNSQNISDNIVAQLEGGTAYRHVAYKVNGKTKYKKEAYKVRTPKGGGVVLMHDIHQRSVDAVKIFLEYAQDNNIDVIPLHDVKEFAYGNRVCELIK